MADIDKSLPNIGNSTRPDEVAMDVAAAEPIVAQGNTETIENPDGSVDINFDPRSAQLDTGGDHFANLAEVIPDDVLNPLGAELVENYADYKSSRADWEKTYTEGLELLGFKYERRTQPFRGASGATHPVLAEAVTQFQSLAYKELLPAEGPVRTQIVGLVTPDRQQQADRVKEYMNYQIMDIMKEYEPEFDQMLFYLPLSGSTFKKVYYDSLLGRPVSQFIQSEDLVVPYNATSLDDAEAIIHVLKVSENSLRKQQVSGFYKDIELQASDDTDASSDVKEKKRKLEGITKTQEVDLYTLLECHVDLDIEGLEDKGQDGEPTGIKLPYIVTVEEGSRKILSVRRNWEQNDPKKTKIQYFVHFKFLPGLGFYGFGLIHMIGGLSRTATAALRQLLDAGTLSNLPSGFKQRGIRVRDDAQPIQPGEFRDVDAPGGNLRDAFMPLPFKEPSQTLLALMGVVVQAGQRFASIADMQVGDGNQQAAVGTTVALLERGSRTMSAIHKRIYAALKQEFGLLAKQFKTNLPPVYPYDVVGGAREIKQADFDDKVDIIPVADPNIFSQTQRISLAQTEMQLAASNPGIHNTYEVYRNMYEALGVKDIDKILVRPQPPQPKDPALEHIDALAGKPFQAFPGQDHRSHITSHLSFMATNMAKNAPPVMASLEKNIFEHISIMAQEHSEVEFRQEMQQLQMMSQQIQQMGQQQGPQGQQAMQQVQMQAKMLQEKIEARKAQLISDAMEEFLKEEQKISSQFDNDPIAALRSRELDLKAQENVRKEQESKDRINIDKMKAMMNQSTQDEKLQQNEDLAKMRANTSIEKTILAAKLKNDSERYKNKV
jgi:hypothetical protein